MAARFRGKAETCVFKATCERGIDVHYTDHAIRDVLLSGISDLVIRREILYTQAILQIPVNDVIVLVEGKYMARNALPSSTLSAVSSFSHSTERTIGIATVSTYTHRPLKTSALSGLQEALSLFQRGRPRMEHQTSLGLH